MLILFLVISSFSFFLKLLCSPCLDYDSFSNKCHICSYDYYQSSPFNFLNSSLFSPDLCVLKGNGSLRSELFVSSNNSYNCNTPCAGNISQPFNSLFSAFYSIMNYGNFSSANITIYLIGKNFHFLYNETNETDEFSFFRRMNLNLTITPLFCSFLNVSGCFAPQEKAEILVKTDTIYFFVSNRMNLINMIFNGNDLNLFYSSPILSFVRQAVCFEGDLDNQSSDPQNKYCYFKNKVSNSSETKMPYGMFNLEYPFDCNSSCPISEITILNCEFNLLNSLKGYSSLIRILKGSPVSINIMNSSFYKLFFLKGIISIINFDDPFYQFISTSLVRSHLDALPKTGIDIAFFGNFIKMYNSYNLTYISAQSMIFCLDHSYCSRFYTQPVSLHFNLANDFYLLNLFSTGNQAILFFISGFGSSTFLNFTNFTLYGNNFLNTLNVFCPSNLLLVQNSNFLNNADSSILIASFNSLNFYNNVILNHSLISTSLFYLLNSKFVIKNCVFKYVWAKINASQPLFGVKTVLKLSTMSIFYVAYSLNVTFDEFDIFNCSLINFIYVNLVESTTTIKHIFISNSSFSNILLTSYTQSLIRCFIEGLIVINQSNFDDITGHFIFRLGYSRNRTFDRVNYVNSDAGFLYCYMMTPYSFHYMQTYFLNVYIDNITIHNHLELLYLIVIIPNYNVDTSDIKILNSTIKNISFNYYDTYHINTLFHIGNPYYMIINNFSISDVSNANVFDLTGQNDFPFVSLLNITNFNITNKNSEVYSFFSSYSIPVIYFKNCFFSSKGNIRSVALNFQCYPICYLAFLNCNFQGLKVLEGIGGALAIIHQNIKTILIKNCYFADNGGAGSYFGDISLSFMAQFSELSANKEDKIKIFQNFYAYCLDPQNILPITKMDLCVNFTNNNKTIISIGEGFQYFSLNEWNTLFFDYGIQNCSFFNSHATSIFIQPKSDFVAKNLLISDIFSSSTPSAFYVSSQASLFLYDSLIQNCFSQVDGGAIIATTSAISYFSNTTFSNISSLQSGGVFNYFEANLTMLYVLISNTNSDQGGVLYAESGFINLTGSSINSSQAKLMGGSFYCSFSNLYISNTSIIGSYCDHNGASLYADRVSMLKLNNVSLSHAISLESGVLYIIGDQAVVYSVNNLRCFSNYAANGACVFMREGKIKLFASFIQNSVAINNLIFAASSFTNVFFEIQDCFFLNNNVSQSALVFLQTQIKISNTIFQDNVFKVSEIQSQFSNLTIINITFSFRSTSNFSLAGYTVIVLFSSGSFQNVTFNKGGQMVGCISSDNSKLKIDNINFMNCQSAKGGGMQIVDFSDINLTSSIFSNNQANSGAGLYILNSYFYSKNNSFFSNQGNDQQGTDIYLYNVLLGPNVVVELIDNYFSKFNSISTILEKAGTIILKNLIFYNDIAGNGNFRDSQGLYIQDVLNIQIEETNFFNLHGLSSITAMNTNQLAINCYISKSIFLNSTTQNSGGALFLNGNFNLTLINNEFSNNYATRDGGAISITCETYGCLQYNISGNLFKNNSAGIYAGAIQFPFLLGDVFKNNAFLENHAKIGDIISSSPNALFITMNFTELSSLINIDKPLDFQYSDHDIPISSGQTAEIDILILDSLHNFLRFESSGAVEINIIEGEDKKINPKKYETLNLLNSKALVKSGKSILSSIVLIGEPGQNYTSQVVLKNSEVTIQTTIVFNVRLCQVGEIFINSKCIPCEPGFYSFETDAFAHQKKTCDSCPDNAICKGYNYVIPKLGYWKRNNVSNLMIPCFNQENCPDQIEYFSQNKENYSYVCLTGSYGNLCANCLMEFGKDSNGICHHCSSDSMLYIRFFVVLFFTFMFLLYQSFVAFKFNANGIIKRSMLKLLINHNYYLSFLQNLKVDWIGNLKTFTEFSDYYATSVPKDIMNFDCFLTYSIDQDSIPIAKVFTFSLFPIFLFGFMAIVRLIILSLQIMVFKKVPKKSDITAKVYLLFGSCFLITIYNFYSRLIMNTLKLLKCISLDQSNQTFLELDPNIECWISNGYHMYLIKTLFSLNFLVWCLGWPISLCLLLKIKNIQAVQKIMRNFSFGSPRSSHIKENDKSSGRKKTNRFKTLNPKIVKSKEENTKSFSKIATQDHKNSELFVKTMYKNKLTNQNKKPDEVSIKTLDSKKSLESYGSKTSHNFFSFFEKEAIYLNPEQKDNIFKGNKILRFLTIDYKPEYYFWEAFFYLSNLTIAFLNVTTSRFDSNSQGGIFIVVYFIMLTINEVLKPFRHDIVSKFASLSYLTIIMTIGLVLMSITSKNASFAPTFYFGLMATINLLFFASWLIKFGKILIVENWKQMKEFTNLIREKTSKYFKSH